MDALIYWPIELAATAGEVKYLDVNCGLDMGEHVWQPLMLALDQIHKNPKAYLQGNKTVSGQSLV